MLWADEAGWRMREVEKVVSIIREVGVYRLGNWDGCCCSSFSIRNVDVGIACGKGRPQGITVGSASFDYEDDEAGLRQIADEVRKQVMEFSGRCGDFPITIARG